MSKRMNFRSLVEKQQKMKERLEAEELKRKGMTRQLLKKQQDHNTNSNHTAPSNKVDENMGRDRSNSLPDMVF